MPLQGLGGDCGYSRQTGKVALLGAEGGGRVVADSLATSEVDTAALEGTKT